MNPYDKHVRRVYGDIKRFPHKLATEYPEEWLCRLLEALKIWLNDRKEGTVRDWEYTHQYASLYVSIAQEALKETMAERVKFLQETVVLPAEDVRDECARLKAENEILKTQNELLQELVRVRSHSLFERVSRSVAEIEQVKGSPHQAARPSGGLVARSTDLGTRSALKRLARKEPEKKLADYLADHDVLPVGRDS